MTISVNRFLGISLAAMAFLQPQDVLAAEGPGFDCSKTESDVERTICDDEYLSLMHREIERQYSALRTSAPDLEVDQKYWLKQRNRCGPDLPCLWLELERRWVALGLRIEESKGLAPVSGFYDFIAHPDEIEGELILAAGAGGDYSFHVSTVTTQHAHMCEAMGTNARRKGTGTLSWQDPDSEHSLSLVPGTRGVMALEITYDHQRAFCGWNAYVNGEYRLMD